MSLRTGGIPHLLQHMPGLLLPLAGQPRHVGHLDQFHDRGIAEVNHCNQTRKRKVRIGSRLQRHGVTGRDRSSLKHTIIPAATPAAQHRFGQPVVLEPQRKLETGLPRLAYL